MEGAMARLEWTEARDFRLRRRRAEGIGWPEIGAELGVTPDVARERGRRIGARFPVCHLRAPAEARDRAPLPAGHPRAWALLTAGTLLADTAWPGWD
jgi:hypothetical protein